MPDQVNTPAPQTPPKTTADPVDTTSPTSTTPPKEPARSSAAQSSSTTSATSIPTESSGDPLSREIPDLIAQISQLRLQSPTSKAHIPFLIFAGLVTSGILTLIGLGDTVPTSIYALDFAALTAAGVSVVPS